MSSKLICIELSSQSCDRYHSLTPVVMKEFQDSLNKFKDYFVFKRWILDAQAKSVKIQIELFQDTLPVEFLQGTIATLLEKPKSWHNGFRAGEMEVYM